MRGIQSCQRCQWPVPPPLGAPRRECSHAPRAPTKQQDDAGQDGDEGAHAEPDGQHEGLGVAGLHGAVAAAATHADGQRARAAHGRCAAVTDHDGQQVHLLLLPAEPAVLGQDTQGVVCKGKTTAHGSSSAPSGNQRTPRQRRNASPLCPTKYVHFLVSHGGNPLFLLCIQHYTYLPTMTHHSSKNAASETRENRDVRVAQASSIFTN